MPDGMYPFTKELRGACQVIPDKAVEAAAKALREHNPFLPDLQAMDDTPADEFDCCARIALETAAVHLRSAGVWSAMPAPDPLVEDLVDLIIEADKTVDSPTVFTRWHHYAEFILSAGYRKTEAAE
jgi:hypothetical protein